MARVAETLVEEWLNRRGYFTIRSLKEGNTEYDLLAVSLRDSDAIHVEVTSSLNPTWWIGKKDLSDNTLPAGKNRSKEQIAEGIKSYVNKKYRGDKASKLRDQLWPEHGNWHFMFVHGKLSHAEEELPYLKNEGIETLSLSELLGKMRATTGLPFQTDTDAAHFVALC